MDAKQQRRVARRDSGTTVENPPGVFRTTLAYNAESLLCHFRLNRGAKIPVHSHPQAQNGYMIRGRMNMVDGKGGSFLALPGTGWCFAPDEQHGAEVLEDSEVIECFAPMRPDYVEG